MTHPIQTHLFANGLALVAQPMPWLESAAFSLLLPAGCSRDPRDLAGLSSFTCEMVQRGCGERDSRQFVADLERLGVDRTASVSNAHATFGGAMLAENLPAALAIFADLVRRPHLPPDQLEEARLVSLQEIRAIEDDLAHKVMLQLRGQHYPDPWGRACQGKEESVEAIAVEDVQQFFQRTYRPRGAILSVAGNIDWPRLVEHVESVLGDWDAGEVEPIQETPAPGGYLHLPHESNQTHIGVAFPSVPYRHPDFYQARGAVGILSDGMSSRLFTEVREKRGLCYTVYASCHSLRERGSVQCYSGTSTERAQETLDVMLAELTRLVEGVQQHELDRLKARIKSSLIMQQESSPSRSSSMAIDWYHLGRVQTLDEVGAIIDGLTCQSINAYLKKHPPGHFTVVTLGEKQLEVPRGVLSPQVG